VDRFKDLAKAKLGIYITELNPAIPNGKRLILA